MTAKKDGSTVKAKYQKKCKKLSHLAKKADVGTCNRGCSQSSYLELFLDSRGPKKSVVRASFSCRIEPKKGWWMNRIRGDLCDDQF